MTFEEIMKFARINKRAFDNLVNSCKNLELYPVIGAGLSVDFGYPDWKKLLLELIDEIESEQKRSRLTEMLEEADKRPDEDSGKRADHRPDYEEIAQEIANILGIELVHENIRRIFSEDSLADVDFRGKAVDVLPYLFKDMMTTNYDRVIERVLTAHGEPERAVTTREQELFTKFLAEKHMIHSVFKLHGDIYSKSEELIFAMDSYNRFYGNPDSELNKELFLSINGRRLFFLGASLDKDRLAQHLITLGNTGNSHFAIMGCNRQKIDDERKRLADYHIYNVIFYPEGEYDCVTVILEKLLECVYPEVYKDKIDNNTISPVAANYVVKAKNIPDEEFMQPSFKVRKECDGESQYQIEGLNGFFSSIHESTESTFLLVDSSSEGEKEMHGGGGMGKTTILAKTYIHNRPKTLFFTLKEYKKDSGMKEQIVNMCKTGRENWILFDGINEMNENDFYSFNMEISEAARNVKAENRNVKFIFSARNTRVLENLHEVFRNDINKIIYEIGYRPKVFEEYFEKNNVKPDDNLRKIMSSPLLISLYVKTKATLKNIAGDVELAGKFAGLYKDENLYNSGEILNNYVLAQKYNYIKKGDVNEVDHILSDILPKLAHAMRDRNRQYVSLNDCYGIMHVHDEKNKEKMHILMDRADKGLNLVFYSETVGNKGDGTVSFVHEEFLDFFEALYLVQKVNECRHENLLHYPDSKNPIDNVRRYYVEILDGFKIERFLEDKRNLTYKQRKEFMTSCAVAAECLGDLFYYKYKYGFKSRFTAGVEGQNEILQKASEYYKIEAEYGDPLGNWNLSIVYRDMLGLDEGQADREKLGENIYLCSEKALKSEKEMIKKISDTENYYSRIGESGEKFYSRIACMENSMAIAYNYGYGIKKNLSLAKKHFREGIKYQYAYSYNRLAQMYENEVKGKMEVLVKGEAAEDEINERLVNSYVTAFVIFWKQIQDVQERYGMNRLSWYVFEGISIKAEKTAGRDFKLLEHAENGYCIRFKICWIERYLDKCPEIGLFADCPELVMQLKSDASTGRLKKDVVSWMEYAAFSGDTYATKRKNKWESGGFGKII